MSETTSVPETLQAKIESLFSRQLQHWPLASKNYAGLKKVKTNYFPVSSQQRIGVQFNPERITSSAAKVDAKSISSRKCFLCLENLPPEQEGVPWQDDYTVLVNPFPIFPKHLTIPDRKHVDQLIHGRFSTMLDLAKDLNDYVVFYNGPKCGASAPDHFHFQAGNKGFLPIEQDLIHLNRDYLLKQSGCQISVFAGMEHPCIILEGDDKNLLTTWWESLLSGLEKDMPEELSEPMINLLVSHNSTEGQWVVLLFPRKLHRPWQYFEEGSNQILLSPASVDLGGMLITPREEDFVKITQSDIADILDQVCFSKEELRHLANEFISNIKTS